jgi:galactofuranose transport system permease protein
MCLVPQCASSSVARVVQTIITFEGTLSSWWTKIFIGALLLVFIVLQKVLTARRR